MKKTKKMWLDKHKELLAEHKIDYIEIEYWHFQLITKRGAVDFYPTTGKWFILKSRTWGQGFQNLLDKL